MHRNKIISISMILLVMSISACGGTTTTSSSDSSIDQSISSEESISSSIQSSSEKASSSSEKVTSSNIEESSSSEEGIIYSQGLEYFGGEVRGIGTCTDKDIIIPLTYETGYSWYPIGDVTGIGRAAFQNTDIESVTFHSNIETIVQYAFNGCEKLTSIEIPNTVKEIGSEVFGNCINLQSVIFEEGSKVDSLGGQDGDPGYMFYHCTNLTEVVLPDSIASIPEGTFGKCTSLVNLTIPHGVTSIARYAFSYCSSLISLTLPNTIESIGIDGYSSGYFVFNECSSLEEINYEGTIEEWNSIRKSKDPRGPGVDDWRYGSAIKVIHCTDGDVTFEEENQD